MPGPPHERPTCGRCTKRLVRYGADGEVVRLAGIMAVVRAGGAVVPGDPIGVQLPAGEHRALQPV